MFRFTKTHFLGWRCLGFFPMVWAELWLPSPELVLLLHGSFFNVRLPAGGRGCAGNFCLRLLFLSPPLTSFILGRWLAILRRRPWASVGRCPQACLHPLFRWMWSPWPPPFSAGALSSATRDTRGLPWGTLSVLVAHVVGYAGSCLEMG